MTADRDADEIAALLRTLDAEMQKVVDYSVACERKVISTTINLAGIRFEAGLLADELMCFVDASRKQGHSGALPFRAGSLATQLRVFSAGRLG